MSGEVEIKPCPFCGGAAAIIRGSTALNSRTQFKVFCRRCQARQPLQKTKIGAIAGWNHREKQVVKTVHRTTCKYMPAQSSQHIFTGTLGEMPVLKGRLL